MKDNAVWFQLTTALFPGTMRMLRRTFFSSQFARDFDIDFNQFSHSAQEAIQWGIDAPCSLSGSLRRKSSTLTVVPISLKSGFLSWFLRIAQLLIFGCRKCFWSCWNCAGFETSQFEFWGNHELCYFRRSVFTTGMLLLFLFCLFLSFFYFCVWEMHILESLSEKSPIEPHWRWYSYVNSFHQLSWTTGNFCQGGSVSFVLERSTWVSIPHPFFYLFLLKNASTADTQSGQEGSHCARCARIKCEFACASPLTPSRLSLVAVTRRISGSFKQGSV